MQIGQALQRVGFAIPEGLDAFILVPGERGLRSAPLASVASREMAGTVYVSGGGFDAGTARRREFLRHVVWLQLDADLKDFLGCEAEELWAMDDEVLDEAIAMLMRVLVSECERCAVPLHRIDSTGYGVCGYVSIEEGDRHRVEEILRAHRAIVARINAQSGIMLLDPQVSDAGTRITRVPGSVNQKGGRERPVRILHETGLTVGVDALSALVGGELPLRPAPAADPTLPLDPEVAGHLAAILKEGWANLVGSRHDAALGIAGVLCSLGVAEEDCAALMDEVTAGDEERRDRMLAVTSTYRAARAGLPISGWSRLRRSLPEGMKEEVEVAVAPLQRQQASTLIIGGEVLRPTPMVAQYDFEPPPSACFRGWVGDYLDLVSHTTEAGDAFHLGTALTVIGGTMGRRAWCRYSGQPVYGNLFSVLVGSAGGSRKDSAVKRGIHAGRILDDGTMQGEPYHVITDIGSSQALIRQLAEHENLVVYLSELSKLTRNARRSGTADLMPTLLEAWDCPPFMEVVSLAAQRDGNNRAESPYLCLIACIQPEILSIEFGAEDSESGLTSRLSYFCGTGKSDPLPDPPAPDAMLMRDLYRRLQRHRAALVPSRGVAVSPDTRDLWSDFYARDRQRTATNLAEDKMRTRLASKVRRYALLYAVSEGEQEIGVPHMEAAIALVEWEWRQVRLIAGDWGASIGNSLERRIRECLADGPRPRFWVRQKVDSPRWGPQEIASVMKAMVENGTLLVHPGNEQIVSLQEVPA